MCYKIQDWRGFALAWNEALTALDSHHRKCGVVGYDPQKGWTWCHLWDRDWHMHLVECTSVHAGSVDADPGFSEEEAREWYFANVGWDRNFEPADTYTPIYLREWYGRPWKRAHGQSRQVATATSRRVALTGREGA